MCPRCDAFHDPVRLDGAAGYAAMLMRARTAVADGELEAMEETVAAGRARHVFACAQCAQLFILEVGGGHVLGDRWRLLHGN